MKRSGFTLIEILVVIAIISVLTAIGVISFTSMQKNARDARRKGDMKSLQSSFEQYYSDNAGAYPVAGTLLTSYLPGGFPKDPKSPTREYDQDYTDTGYCFCAELDTPSGNSEDSFCTFNADGLQPYYCVKSLQR